MTPASEPAGRLRPVSSLPPVRPPLRVAWEQELGDAGRAVPPATGGEVVVGRGAGTVAAFSTVDGRPLWRVDFGAAPDESVLVGTGEAVVAAAADGDAVEVAALAWATGERRWHSRLPGEPVAAGLGATATAVRVLTGGAGQRLLHELDPRTGRPHRSVPVPPTCERLLARPAHTLLGARDLVGDDAGLYRLAADAQTPVRLDPAGVWSLHRGAVVDVASVGDYGSDDRYLLALDPGSGEPRWRRDALTELVAVDGAEVACMESGPGADEQVLVLRAASDGDEIWRAEPQEFLFSSQVFFTGAAVGVVDIDGIWFADRVTGRELGRVPLEGLESPGLCVQPAGLVFRQAAGLSCLRQE